MHKLVISNKFKRAFRKFARRNADLQAKIEVTLAAMENDISHIPHPIASKIYKRSQVVH
jgi:hypothetical protein